MTLLPLSVLSPELIRGVEEILGSAIPLDEEEKLDLQSAVQEAMVRALEIPTEEERVTSLERAMYRATERLISRRFAVAA
jgi:hypothetical protein